MRLTFDTNALLSATLWEGSVSQKLLFKLIDKNAEIFCSTEIISEYSKVLERDFDYSQEQRAEILQSVLSFVTLTKPVAKISAVSRDPSDDKILDCAVDSKSEYVITYDKHLLELKQFQGIHIIKPEEALKII